MVEKVIQTFEELIRRSLAPSMTLFVLLALGDLVHAEVRGSAWERALRYAEFTSQQTFGVSSTVFITVLLLVVIGVSYALSALQQLVFDNRLKKNFDPPFPGLRKSGSRASEARALQELRAKVQRRLGNEPALSGLQGLGEVSDYLLYELLGSIDPTNTRPFVDTAKAIGITCVSLVLVLTGNALYFFCSFSAPHHGWALLLLVPAAGVYWWGKDATLAQYRARALRLYVNFLAMPSELIQRRLSQWGGGKALEAVPGGAKP